MGQINDRLTANASKEVNEDRTFPAILTHIGVNNNRIELTLDEAKKALAKHDGFIYLLLNQAKIKNPAEFHEKSSRNTFGKGFDLHLVEDGENTRIEYTGEAYDNLPEHRHAYQVITDGFYDFDSYDVDYEEGECSKCGKRFRNASEACNHLGRRGGMVVGTDQAHVIMHDVTFKGAAFLDQPGGDPKARVLNSQKVQAVACLIGQSNLITEDNQMAKEVIKAEEATKVEGQPTDELDAAKAEIAELKEKFKGSEKSNKALQTTVDTYEAAKKEARIDTLIEMQKTKGMVLDDKALEVEKADLMKLDDAGLTREEARFNRLPDKVEAVAETPADDTASAESTPVTPPKAEASTPVVDPKMVAQANNAANVNGKPADIKDPTEDTDTNIVANFAEARRRVANNIHTVEEE